MKNLINRALQLTSVTVLLLMFGQTVMAQTGIAQTNLENAESYAASGKLFKSNYYYIKAIKHNSDNIQARLGLAKNHISSRHYDLAQQQLNEILNRQPGHRQALLLLANVYTFTSNHSGMATLAPSLEAIAASDEAVLRSLSSLHGQLGNNDKVEDYSSQLSKLQNLNNQ